MDRGPASHTGYPDLLPMFELFEWTFQFTLTPEHQDALAQQVVAGWNNEDHSEQNFVRSLLRIQEYLVRLPPEKREECRPAFERDLRSVMAMRRPDDCGRVLHVLGSVLQATDHERMRGQLFDQTLRNISQQMRDEMRDVISRNLRGNDPSTPSVSVAPGQPAASPWSTGVEQNTDRSRASHVAENVPVSERDATEPAMTAPAQAAADASTEILEGRAMAYVKQQEEKFLRDMYIGRMGLLTNAWAKPW